MVLTTEMKLKTNAKLWFVLFILVSVLCTCETKCWNKYPRETNYFLYVDWRLLELWFSSWDFFRKE